MNAVLIVITVVQLLVALALILIVLFQSGKSQGLSGAIGGIADSYMSRSKAKSMDAKLARCTKWVAAVFVVLVGIRFFKNFDQRERRTFKRRRNFLICHGRILCSIKRARRRLENICL
mgnify:CR=1 FL=1